MKKANQSAVFYLLSRKDTAGMNIQKFLPDRFHSNVFTLEMDSIYATDEIKDKIPENGEIIFLSRHLARSFRPSFTVHPIGNFSSAEFGGIESKLVPCNSFRLKNLLLMIKSQMQPNKYNLRYNYEISIEVTHHGPFASQMVSFIEVGSTQEQWSDFEACRLIAHSIIDDHSGINNQQENWISAIGFGGNHYSTKFTQLVLESELAFGHVCAKYAISSLNADLVGQMIEKTYPSPKKAVFDKKSMKRKQEVKSWLSEYDIEVLQI